MNLTPQEVARVFGMHLGATLVSANSVGELNYETIVPASAVEHH